jgi:hypothetical protein
MFRGKNRLSQLLYLLSFEHHVREVFSRVFCTTTFTPGSFGICTVVGIWQSKVEGLRNGFLEKLWDYKIMNLQRFIITLKAS